jgi:hypothetical protein
MTMERVPDAAELDWLSGAWCASYIGCMNVLPVDIVKTKKSAVLRGALVWVETLDGFLRIGAREIIHTCINV